MDEKNIYTSGSTSENITKYDSYIRPEYSSKTDSEKDEHENKYVTAKPRKIIIKARLIND